MTSSTSISHKTVENLIHSLCYDIVTKPLLRESTRYCQIKLSPSRAETILAPLTRLGELIQKTNDRTTFKHLEALNNFTTQHASTISQLREYRKENPHDYRHIANRIFSFGNYGNTERVLDYITSTFNAVNSLSDEDIRELGELIYTSEPKDCQEMKKILTSKVGELSSQDLERLKNRLNHLFNETIHELEDPDASDLDQAHYEFIQYDEETKIWNIGPDAEFQWAGSQGFWEQKLNQFLENKTNLDEINEVGIRQNLVDALFDFNILHFNNDDEERSIENRISAYITCIGYSPYTLSEGECKQLADRLSASQDREISKITEIQIHSLMTIKELLSAIQPESPKEKAPAAAPADFTHDLPLPLNSPLRTPERIAQEKTLSPEKLETATRQIRNFGKMIRNNSALANLRYHLGENSYLSDAGGSEIDTINKIIARSNGKKLKDLTNFKNILEFNLEEIKSLSQFRKQFPVEYHLLVDELYKGKTSQIDILDFLTGPDKIRSGLIERFCKYILDVEPEFRFQLYTILISKNYDLSFNENRLIQAKTINYLKNKIEKIKETKKYESPINYENITYNRKDDTYTYFGHLVFDPSKRMAWKDQLINHIAGDSRLQEVDPTTGIRSHLINRLYEFNITNFYDRKNRRNVKNQIEAFLISYQGFSLNKKEALALTKMLETEHAETQAYKKMLVELIKAKNELSAQFSRIEYQPELKLWLVKPKTGDEEKFSSSPETISPSLPEGSSSEESPARSAERTPLKTPEKYPESPPKKTDASGIIPNYLDLENSPEGQAQQLKMNEFLRYTSQDSMNQGLELLSQKDRRGDYLYEGKTLVNVMYRMPPN